MLIDRLADTICWDFISSSYILRVLAQGVLSSRDHGRDILAALLLSVIMTSTPTESIKLEKLYKDDGASPDIPELAGSSVDGRLKTTQAAYSLPHIFDRFGLP